MWRLVRETLRRAALLPAPLWLAIMLAFGAGGAGAAVATNYYGANLYSYYTSYAGLGTGTYYAIPPCITSGGASCGTQVRWVPIAGSCIIGGGTCTIIVSLTYPFTSNASYGCFANIYGTGGSSASTVQTFNSSGSQVNIQVNTAASGTAQVAGACIGQ